MTMSSKEEIAGESNPPASSLDLQVAHLPAIVWATDARLHFTSLAGSELARMEIDPAPFRGAPIEELFATGKASTSPALAHLRALKGAVERFDIELKGSALEARVAALYGSDGRVTGVAGVALNRTAQHVAEKALRLSEQSYRTLIEEAPYAISRSTRRGQFLQVNRAMAEMLGYESEADLLLANIGLDIFAESEDYRAFVRELQERGSLQGFQTRWLAGDGRTVHVSIGGRAVRDQSGQLLYFDVLAENITARKHMEEQLRQAQKMQAIGRLAGGIAHDFNNLLTVIKGQMEMTLQSVHGKDPLRLRLEEVEKAADRAAKLTRQLLAFVRTQAAEIKILNLNELVDGMTQMLQRLIGESIEMSFEPGEHLGTVAVDPAQLEPALLNLAINAKDAMPAGGQLVIATCNVQLPAGAQLEFPMPDPGDYVVLSVSDTGTGMSAETRTRIYEPFFTTKPPGQGTGLGLYNVYCAVKQNKGFIEVTSELGKGSRFALYFPRVDEPAVVSPPDAAQPVPMPYASKGGETVLLAEDEPSIRMLASTFLEQLGYHVLSAEDGEDAKKVAAAYPGRIDLLISDVVMPKLGGRQLAEDLRKSIPGIKVLLMSGYAGDAEATRAIEESKTRLLQKPFPSMQFLAQVVRETLDER